MIAHVGAQILEGLPMADAAVIEEMSFETALAELEQIVDRLERGDVPLAESVSIYERGEALKQHSERLLKEAEMRVEKIRLGGDGRPVDTEPLDES